MTSAVVFAYSEVGVRCVRELLAQRVDIPLLFTHADDPNETQWFGSAYWRKDWLPGTEYMG